MSVQADKDKNIEKASQFIRKAAHVHGADLVVLPECFNSLYGTQYFAEYAESLKDEGSLSSSKTLLAISQVARETGIYVVAGSIPEYDSENNKLFNTSATFDRKGSLIAKHRKSHLFDINVPGKITFQESAVLSPGSRLTTFDTEYCKIGMGICFDIRFAEMAQVYQRAGCKLIIYPGAFNLTTGPAHWELLARARAVDNQLFVVTCSPARDSSASYVAWGHSMVVDPWGTKIAEADETEQLVVADIDFSRIDEIREQLPVVKGKRRDLYDTISK